MSNYVTECALCVHVQFAGKVRQKNYNLNCTFSRISCPAFQFAMVQIILQCTIPHTVAWLRCRKLCTKFWYLRNCGRCDPEHWSTKFGFVTVHGSRLPWNTLLGCLVDVELLPYIYTTLGLKYLLLLGL